MRAPLVIALLALAPSPTGPELHVAPGGDDAASGSRQAPLRTLDAAARRAKPGVTVYIHAGTYSEPLVTRHAGRPGAPITYRGLGAPVITGVAQPGQPSAQQNVGLVELNHPHSVLLDVRVLHSPNTGVLLNADALRVEACEVAYSQRHGISTHTSRQPKEEGLVRDVVVANNRVHHSNLARDRGLDAGQAVSVIAEGFSVAGNHVYDNRDIGIDIWLGARHGEVVDNLVERNRAAGIYVDGAAFVKIHRNHVRLNGTGVGVSSEDPRYDTRHIWAYNNLIVGNRDAGAFVWDDIWQPGHRGSQAVLFAHNTLVDNPVAFRLTGGGNSGRICNNLAVVRQALALEETTSGMAVDHNVWLTSATGFVDGARRDYRLLSTSPAVDAGVELAPLADGRGGRFGLDSDMVSAPRRSGLAPDAGALEYSGSAIGETPKNLGFVALDLTWR